MVTFEANLKQNQAAIKETEQKIQKLEQQLTATSDRVKTLDRVSDAALLLQQHNTTLLNLELQRSQLLTKYDHLDYPLVKDVEKQIEQTKQAISVAQQSPIRDTTTDHDQTYELIRQDLAKAQSQLAARRVCKPEINTLSTNTAPARCRWARISRPAGPAARSEGQ